MSESSLNFLQRDYSFNFEKYFDRGWNIFCQYPWGFIGFVILNLAISRGLSLLPQSQAEIATTLYNLVSPVLTAGYSIVAIKIAQDRSKKFADFFAGFQRFVSILLVSLVSISLIIFGTFLLIIPGIYLAVSYLFALLFVIEYRLNIWAALEASRKIISKKWLSFLGFTLALVYINLVGFLFLNLGLLFTIPLSYCAIVAAFEDIVGWKTVDLAKAE